MANELALGTTGYGADISITPTGDFLVLVDTQDDPAASKQRLARIILTNPIGFDQFGNGVSRPDDLFNPWLGAGARYAIGKPLTPALITWLQNHIIAAIAADPNFTTSPPPIVQPFVDGTGNGQIYLYVQAITSQGYVAVLSSLPIQFF
jgi:hypothetical protein